MADDPKPYVPHNPGDLITAEDWNDMQVDVRKDMAAQNRHLDSGRQGRRPCLECGQDWRPVRLRSDQIHSRPKSSHSCRKGPDTCKSSAISQSTPTRSSSTISDLSDHGCLSAGLLPCGLRKERQRCRHSRGVGSVLSLPRADEPRLRLPEARAAIEIETRSAKYRILWKILIDQLVEQKLLHIPTTPPSTTSIPTSGARCSTTRTMSSIRMHTVIRRGSRNVRREALRR